MSRSRWEKIHFDLEIFPRPRPLFSPKSRFCDLRQILLLEGDVLVYFGHLDRKKSVCNITSGTFSSTFRGSTSKILVCRKSSRACQAISTTKYFGLGGVPAPFRHSNSFMNIRSLGHPQIQVPVFWALSVSAPSARQEAQQALSCGGGVSGWAGFAVPRGPVAPSCPTSTW